MSQKAGSPHDWPLGTSTALLPNFDLESLIACHAAGIRYLEFVVKANDPEGEARFDALAHEAANRGMQVWSVHLPFGRDRDISSLDASVRETWIQKNIQIMKRAAGWGVKKAIIHPSYEPIPNEERAERMRFSVESLQALGEAADQLGIQVAVECLPRTCLANTSEETLALVNAHPNLGICCDVNHLLHETPQDFIDAVGSKIVTLHISDYDAVDEKHWLPGRGVIDWDAVLAALVRVGYDGPFMFEVSNRHSTQADYITPQVLADCWQRLKAAY